ncbi:MAG: hypothetical protein F4227_08670 [Gammaproteobacteria bacterium]|nr:hypothetical protein [Gammaproteobacteria bacterium]MYF03022.1 hypothetical protein [Gammaproteobacteria bacterium]MYI77211.1 hypothetical protein [Gammaproteobacteria bacterium]
MSRLTDAQVRGKGTAVVVQNVEDLLIYHGKLKPLFSAPCDNWFEDIDPPEKVPTGYIAVRQLSTGCLAFLPKDKLEAWDYSKDKSEAWDDSNYESETLDGSNYESETLDRKHNRRKKLRRSKNNIEDWSEIGIIAAILAFFFPHW